MTNYPRTSYAPEESISFSARRVWGIGYSTENSPLMRPGYHDRRGAEADDGDGRELYLSRSGLPSLVGKSGGYEHLREDKKKMSLESIPIAEPSGVYHAR